MSKIREFPRVRKDRDYAYIRLNGRKIQLGKWNSPEAEKAYRQLQAAWVSNPTAASVKHGETVLLDQLCLAFLQGRGDNKNDHGNYKTAIEVLLSVYSGEPAESFDFSHLEVVRNQFIRRGYSRSHINKLTGMVRGIFYWGVPRKLVPASVAESIRYLKPLKKHQTTAPENVPRQDVPDEIVEQTLPYLLPTIADMVRVQRAACMRPSEVCWMQVGEIDRSDEIWVYRPEKHKTAWMDVVKEVALGPLEQAIIAPRLIGKRPTDPVFSPKDTMKECRERKAANRKTKIQPSQAKRHEEAAKKPKRVVGDFYKEEYYAQNISRTIERANERLPEDERIEPWVPYQLRHTAVTEIIRTTGNRDIARAVAGQKTLSVTQRYNHGDLAIAIEQAKKRKID